MRRITDIDDLRAARLRWRDDGRTVSLVPTMGNLHEGHLVLVDAARAAADVVICSVFVNPTQFGPDEDYDAYPRTLDQDVAMLDARGCAAVFAPTAATMYPNGPGVSTTVRVPALIDVLCGERRAGHFDGVASVVTLLLNLVQPDVAIFGEKDFQQLQVIRRLVADLHLPVQIQSVPIVREADGLAMSSRNRYLTAKQRAVAPSLNETLESLAAALANGAPSQQRLSSLETLAMDKLRARGFEPEYVSVRRASDLADPQDSDRDLRVFAAARLGAARLIDNRAVIWE